MYKAILRRTALLALATASLGPVAGASDVTEASPSGAPTHGSALAAAIEPGMQVAAVVELLGRAADSTERVGVGCGFLDVSRWNDLPVKVISIGGRVDSVVPGEAAQPPTQ